MEILTTREVSKLLKISVTTINRMAAKDDIPHKRVGGQNRFLKSEIEKWFFESLFIDPRTKSLKRKTRGMF